MLNILQMYVDSHNSNDVETFMLCGTCSFIVRYVCFLFFDAVDLATG